MTQGNTMCHSLITAVDRISAANKQLEQIDTSVELICKEILSETDYHFVAFQLIHPRQGVIETTHVELRKDQKQNINDWAGYASHPLSKEAKLQDIQAEIALSKPPTIKIVSGWYKQFDPWIYERFEHNKFVRVYVPVIVLKDSNGNVSDNWKILISTQNRRENDLYDRTVDKKGHLKEVVFSEIPSPPCADVIGTIEAGYKIEDTDYLELAKRISFDDATRLFEIVTGKAESIKKRRLCYALDVIAKEARSFIKSDYVSIHFYRDADDLRYVYQACSGNSCMDLISDHPPRNDGIGALSIQQKKPVVRQEQEDDANSNGPGINPLLWDKGIKSIAAFPLLLSNFDSGVLYIAYRRPHSFTSDDMENIQLFANRAVDSIESATRYVSTRRDAHALGNLHTVANSIMALDDPDALLHQIAGAAINVLSADIVNIYEYSQALNNIIGLPDIKGKLLDESNKEKDRTPSARMIIDILESYRPIITDEDYWNGEILRLLEERRGEEFVFPVREFITTENIRSCAAVLLRIQKEVVGIMFLLFRKRQKFLQQQKRMIEILGASVAISIKNERSMRALEFVHEIGECTDQKGVFNVAAMRAATGVEANQAWIHTVIAPGSQELLLRAAYPEQTRLATLSTKPIGYQAIEKIAKSRRPRIIKSKNEQACIALSGNPTEDDDEFDSIASAPMIDHQGNLLGIITVAKASGIMSTRDLSFLYAVSQYVSIALQNMDAHKRRIDAEYMAKASDLAGCLVHEVKDNLGAIQVFANKLKNRADNTITPDLDNIIEMANSSLADARNTLCFFNAESEVVDIARVISSAIKQARIESNIRLALDGLNKPCLINGWEMQLFYAVLNIIENACDAMPEGGDLAISIKSNKINQNFVEVEISDTGIGMDDDQISRVFEKNYTSKQSKENNLSFGYGLWWTKKYIERIGGALHAESVIGVGSSFYIVLPTPNNTNYRPVETNPQQVEI